MLAESLFNLCKRKGIEKSVYVLPLELLGRQPDILRENEK